LTAIRHGFNFCRIVGAVRERQRPGAVRVRVVVINLERSVRRRERMAAGLAALDLQATFFPAVDAARGEHQHFPQYDPEGSRRFFGLVMKPAEHACFASHFLLWQQCAEQAAPLVVLEDDCDVGADFPRALDAIRPVLDEVGLIRLYASTRRPFRRIRTLAGGFELIRYTRGPSGTVCYALTPAAARRLLLHCPRWLEPVDRFLDRFWVHGLGHHGLHPAPVTHAADAGSDIGCRRREKTPWTVLRRILRVGDHAARIVYNLRLHGGSPPIAPQP
jgi:glycosyl transferase, family 25